MGDQQDKLKQPEFKVREESTVTLSVDSEPDCPLAVEPELHEPGFSSNINREPERPKFKLSSGSIGGGLLRHRLIVSGCLLFSISFMAFGVLDFSPLVKTRGQVDTSMKFTAYGEPAELPLNTEYIDNQWVNGRYEPEDSELRRIREDSWNSDSKFGFADRQGKIVIPPQFTEVQQFRDGLAAVRVDSKWGFIDQTGKMVIKPTFTYAHDSFHNGIAVVQDADGNSMLIDRTGNVIVRTGSGSLTRMGNLWQGWRSSPVSEIGKVGYNPAHALWFNRKGQTVDLSEYEHVERIVVDSRYNRWGNVVGTNIANKGSDEEEYIRTTKNGKFGLLDADGNLISKPIFDDIGPMVDGYAAFVRDDKFGFPKIGFLNKAGKTVLETDFSTSTAFNDLIAGRDSSGSKWQVIDKNGHPVDIKIDGIIDGPGDRWMSDGLGAVIQGDKVGFINTKGQMVIPPQFDFALPFHDGFAPVWDGNFWHFIDKTGKLADLPNFIKVGTFANGIAEATVPGPLNSIIDAAMLRNNKEHMDSVRRQFRDSREGLSKYRRGYGN